MIVTAHGGALDTGRNTLTYLQKMCKFNIDAIEIDIRRMFGKLYLAHTPFDLLNPKKLSLAEAFIFVKENGWSVNCDVKFIGLVKPVLEEAGKTGIEDKVIFTGSVSPHDVKHLNAGCAYLNASFFPYKMKAENVPKIKAFIEKFDNPRLKGININYRKITDEFADACQRENLDISAYTVDVFEHIERVVKYPAVVNVTTNIHHKALQILGREVMK